MVIAKLSLNNPYNISHCYIVFKDIFQIFSTKRQTERERGRDRQTERKKEIKKESRKKKREKERKKDSRKKEREKERKERSSWMPNDMVTAGNRAP